MSSETLIRVGDTGLETSILRAPTQSDCSLTFSVCRAAVAVPYRFRTRRGRGRLHMSLRVLSERLPSQRPSWIQVRCVRSPASAFFLRSLSVRFPPVLVWVFPESRQV